MLAPRDTRDESHELLGWRINTNNLSVIYLETNGL